MGWGEWSPDREGRRGAAQAERMGYKPQQLCACHGPGTVSLASSRRGTSMRLREAFSFTILENFGTNSSRECAVIFKSLQKFCTSPPPTPRASLGHRSLLGCWWVGCSEASRARPRGLAAAESHRACAGRVLSKVCGTVFSGGNR